MDVGAFVSMCATAKQCKVVLSVAYILMMPWDFEATLLGRDQ